jgi:hypothetical protein
MELAMLDRRQILQLMETVETRTVGYVKTWLKEREFKAAVHRYDRDQDSEKKVVNAG